MQAIVGILIYKETYSSLKMCKNPDKLCTMFKIVHNLISFNFLHQLLYITTVDAGLMCTFNHFLTPTLFCIHLYLVLYISSWNSLPSNLLMLLLYLHLKHCIRALKFVNRVHLILAHATVVPFALMHKFIIEKIEKFLCTTV